MYLYTTRVPSYRFIAVSQIISNGIKYNQIKSKNFSLNNIDSTFGINRGGRSIGEIAHPARGKKMDILLGVKFHCIIELLDIFADLLANLARIQIKGANEAVSNRIKSLLIVQLELLMNKVDPIA